MISIESFYLMSTWLDPDVQEYVQYVSPWELEVRTLSKRSYIGNEPSVLSELLRKGKASEKRKERKK